MASKRHLRRKQCEGKRRYDDQADADHAAGYVRWSRKTTVFSYKCPHCAGWHIGHPQKIASQAQLKARRMAGDKYVGPGHRDH